MTALRSRIKRLETRPRPATVLIALIEPGETAEEAIERTARAWSRPAESFGITIAVHFVGAHA